LTTRIHLDHKKIFGLLNNPFKVIFSILKPTLGGGEAEEGAGEAVEGVEGAAPAVPGGGVVDDGHEQGERQHHGRLQPRENPAAPRVRRFVLAAQHRRHPTPHFAPRPLKAHFSTLYSNHQIFISVRGHSEIK